MVCYVKIIQMKKVFGSAELSPSNLQKCTDNPNVRFQCSKRKRIMKLKKPHLIIRLHLNYTHYFTEKSGQDPKLPYTSQTGFRTWPNRMICMCHCWYQLERMENYKSCMTQKSMRLVETHGQISQVISEICIHTCIEDKNMHAHTNREEGKWEEQ